MVDEPLTLRIIAGPNGSGKSTLAALLFRGGECSRFINADVIARGINQNGSGVSDLVAGRTMIHAINQALESKESFSFETTMSGKSWIPLIKKALAEGYQVELLYVYLESPEMCMKRVRSRVAAGGHNIPEQTLRRRYTRSLAMFASKYSDLIDNWYIFDNSNGAALMIAQKYLGTISIFDQKRYEIIRSYAK